MIDPVDLIQAMLAPGIMISACGLLLLGMNNKYSLVVNRIRLLDEEKRKLQQATDTNSLSENRLVSVTQQLEVFHLRIRLVRNAVLFYSIAVGFFILASFFIGAQVFWESYYSLFAFLAFLLGMISVFVGIVYAAREVIRGYQIVTIEISNT